MRNTIATLRLFRETVTCRSCGHAWQAYLHGFSRGHGVLIREGKIAFVPDDLSYALAKQIGLLSNDQSSRLDDPADALRSHGWHDVERCPNCMARDLVAEYDQSRMADVDCIVFVADDFSREENRWHLSANGLAKMNGK
jgi:hypothetical protein